MAAFPTSPSRMTRSRVASRLGSGIGMPEIRAYVYGCSGCLYSSVLDAISTILPRYITATLSLMCLTTARSCATNRYVRFSCCCRFSSKASICACIETSSADTGSSHTMN